MDPEQKMALAQSIRRAVARLKWIEKQLGLQLVTAEEAADIAAEVRTLHEQLNELTREVQGRGGGASSVGS